jgi:hypothetical protein
MQNRKGKFHMFSKLAMLVVLFIFILLAHVATAGEIYLKDGNVLRVENCEERDGLVIFNLEGSGQLYSMDMALVEKIKCSRSAPNRSKKKK